MFNFNPYNSKINIRLAKEYEPKILKNKINFRPYNGILIILSGEYHYTLEDESEYTAHQGEMIYLPRHMQPYSYEIICGNTPPKTLQLEFEIEENGNLLSFSEQPVIISDFNLFEITQTLKEIISEFTSSNPTSKLMAMSNLYKFISAFEYYGKEDVNSMTSNTILPAVLYIEEHYGEVINTNYLAEICHISPSQLRRNFNAVFGVPPIEYKNRIIFRVSKKLIKTGVFKIGEISDMLGFNDIYEFSHFFTKRQGVSPKKYQETNNAHF